MKSPITGKTMLLKNENRVMIYKKQSFQMVFHFYKCEDSGEQFTTTELDEININQIFTQYKNLNNI